MVAQLTYCDVCKTSNAEVNFALVSINNDEWVRICSDCFVRLLERFGHKAGGICLGNLDLSESLEPVFLEFMVESAERDAV